MTLLAILIALVFGGSAVQGHAVASSSAINSTSAPQSTSGIDEGIPPGYGS